MATWQDSLTLTAPAGLTGLVDGLDTLVTAANATLDAAETAMDAAKLFLTGTAAPEAAAAAALVTEAQNLVNDIFGAGFFQAVVHPWTPGVSRGDGPWRSLAFPACVSTLSKALDDAGDDARPQLSNAAAVDMVALVAGAASPALFQTTLEALNALLDSRQLRLAIRRLQQAFRLEAERFTDPVASTPPDFQGITVRDALPALAPLEDALKANLAMLESYAAGATSAVDIAASLITAKRAQLTTLQNRLNTAAALFGQGISGAGVYGLRASGTGGNTFVKATLQGAAGAPGPELSFCAGALWVGTGGSLTALGDVLGV